MEESLCCTRPFSTRSGISTASQGPSWGGGGGGGTQLPASVMETVLAYPQCHSVGNSKFECSVRPIKPPLEGGRGGINWAMANLS